MGQTIFITDPAVAAAYRVHPAEWAWVADDVEAAWLIAQRHGYSMQARSALPSAYYVHASAPSPFVAYPGAPPAPAPAPTPTPAPAPTPTPAPAPLSAPPTHPGPATEPAPTRAPSARGAT